MKDQYITIRETLEHNDKTYSGLVSYSVEEHGIFRHCVESDSAEAEEILFNYLPMPSAVDLAGELADQMTAREE